MIRGRFNLTYSKNEAAFLPKDFFTQGFLIFFVNCVRRKDVREIWLRPILKTFHRHRDEVEAVITLSYTKVAAESLSAH